MMCLYPAHQPLAWHCDWSATKRGLCIIILFMKDDLHTGEIDGLKCLHPRVEFH